MTPAADTFRAVSDPTRRGILDALVAGEHSVSELCGMFEMSQPAVSQHLKVLREAGLVTPRREGKLRMYSLEAAPLQQVFDWAGHYQRFWEKKLDALGAVLDREAAKSRRKK